MLNLDELRVQLNKYSVSHISRQTGLHRNVIYRLVKGIVTNPNVETVQRLQVFLESKDGL